ncbi:hypothetical protein OIU77_017160 [Salix suchowensis]|uniref:Bifunctional inhibitor/plant lipid transfer protein/seed storage helical domain-containing protein n=1 Tax=Salix suchowensis TaxID=1278906 RepID=A0ABQ8ZMW4_9ROSI|nr:hypothetical protein OIU77_017160 [Salix suchowensis]
MDSHSHYTTTRLRNDRYLVDVSHGDAKAPTPDCCNGLKQVLKDNKKCLCVIIKDRNDPELGLKINATLALSLPSVCHAPANVSQCPALLNLPPNSPDAQIFYQLANSSSHGASSPAPSPGPSAGAQSQGSNGCRSGKMIFGLAIVSLGLCFHICSLLFM